MAGPGFPINPMRRCRGSFPPLQPAAMAAPAPRSEFTRDLPDLAATRAFARELAPVLRRGDVVGLSGELGSGKTAFARALIEALAERFHCPREEVPSPTFTLVQTYDFPGLSVWHFDLYRIESPEEAAELGIEEAFASALSLIEWPERLGPYLPPGHLSIALEYADGEARRARITAPGAWAARLAPLARHA